MEKMIRELSYTKKLIDNRIKEHEQKLALLNEELN